MFTIKNRRPMQIRKARKTAYKRNRHMVDFAIRNVERMRSRYARGEQYMPC